MGQERQRLGGGELIPTTRNRSPAYITTRVPVEAARLSHDGAVIRIRRVRSRFPLGRTYEVQVQPQGRTQAEHRRVTRAPLRLLEPLLGTADAWSFIDEADRAWTEGKSGWAVEFEESAE